MQTEGVRTPAILHFDKETWILILEDVGHVPSLKGWLKPGVDTSHAQSYGTTLGRYLANIHNKTADNDQIQSQFTGNNTAKRLSSTLYFTNLPKVAEFHGFTGDHIRKAAAQGEREVYEATDVLTLGDFWTGNVLVAEDGTLFVLDLELVKPGTAEFDIGQMAAEMYCIAAFRDRELGTIVLNAFLCGYREVRNGKVSAAKVAIRMGAHFMVIMPMAWRAESSEEELKEQLRYGDDLLRMGVNEDRKGLTNSILKPLIS